MKNLLEVPLFLSELGPSNDHLEGHLFREYLFQLEPTARPTGPLFFLTLFLCLYSNKQY